MSLLENLWFDLGEEANDPSFVDRLGGGDTVAAVTEKADAMAATACRQDTSARWYKRARPSAANPAGLSGLVGRNHSNCNSRGTSRSNCARRMASALPPANSTSCLATATMVSR